MTEKSLKAKQMILASKIALKRSQNNEKQLKKELSQYFKKIEKQIQTLLQEYGTSIPILQGQIQVILSPIKNSSEEYYQIIEKHILREFKAGQKEGDRLVQLNNEDLITDVMNEIRRKNLFGTLQYSETQLLEQAFIASQTTLKRVDENIKNILTKGYKSGKGIDHVGRQLTRRFHQLRTWEANRIARTEIHTAHNQGIMNSYETLGVSYTQWMSAHDKRVRGHKKTDRANHIIMDGEIIPFGGTYSNDLKYPGDKSGRIEEWINCRCSNAPFVMPDGMMAPPGMSHFTEDDLIPIK